MKHHHTYLIADCRALREYCRDVNVRNNNKTVWVLALLFHILQANQRQYSLCSYVRRQNSISNQSIYQSPFRRFLFIYARDSIVVQFAQALVFAQPPGTTQGLHVLPQKQSSVQESQHRKFHRHHEGKLLCHPRKQSTAQESQEDGRVLSDSLRVHRLLFSRQAAVHDLVGEFGHMSGNHKGKGPSHFGSDRIDDSETQGQKQHRNPQHHPTANLVQDFAGDEQRCYHGSTHWHGSLLQGEIGFAKDNDANQVGHNDGSVIRDEAIALFDEGLREPHGVAGHHACESLVAKKQGHVGPSGEKGTDRCQP